MYQLNAFFFLLFVFFPQFLFVLVLVFCITFHHKEKLVLSSTALICIIADGEILTGHTGAVKKALFLHNDKRIVSAADDKTVR